MTTAVYRIVHRTEYIYEQQVSASYGQLHLLPRELPSQRTRRADVVIDPLPEIYRERLDFFGNRAGYFALHEPHTHLTVRAESVVEVEDKTAELSLFGQRPWETVRDAVAGADPAIGFDVAQYMLDSPLVSAHDEYRSYAASSFAPGVGVIDAIASLCNRIHSDFEYAPGVDVGLDSAEGGVHQTQGRLSGLRPPCDRVSAGAGVCRHATCRGTSRPIRHPAGRS